MSKHCVIVPIIGYKDVDNCLNIPIVFGSNDVVLVQSPEWFAKLRKDPNLDVDKEQRLIIKRAKHTMISEYDTDNMFADDPEWQGGGKRQIRDRYLKQIQHANLALWITKPTRLGFSLIIDAQYMDEEFVKEKGWVFVDKRTIAKIVPHKWNIKDTLSKEDLDEAKSIYLFIKNAESKGGSVWRAITSLDWALSSHNNWDQRYLLLWISLESLFSPGEPQELSYRMSQRIAFFLADKTSEVKDIFTMAKKLYRCRSKIVHGHSLSKRDIKNSPQMLFDTEQLTRRSLKRILSNNETTDIFNSKKRDGYLDDIVLSKF